MLIETFTALLTAHLAADFVFQTNWLVTRKRQLKFLALHSVIVAIATAVAIAPRTTLGLVAVVVIAATHMLIDHIKVNHTKNGPIAFILDQLAHLVILAAIAVSIPSLAGVGYWALLPGNGQAWLYADMTLASGFILAVPFGGIVIKNLVVPLAPPAPPPTNQNNSNQPAVAGPIPSSPPAVPAATPGPAPAATASPATMATPATASPATMATPATSSPTQALTSANTGMAQGGKYIGWLERGLTLAFVIGGRFEAVGFLLTAKSILRFGDIKSDGDRHVQEYIIIGTMLSFGWGIAVALATARAFAYWGVG